MWSAFHRFKRNKPGASGVLGAGVVRFWTGHPSIRKRVFVAGSFLVCLPVAFIAFTSSEPRYLAEARVMIEPVGPNGEPDNGTPGRDAIILHEMERLRSRDVAVRAAQAMHLATNPKFTAASLPLGDRIARFFGINREEPAITLLQKALSVEALDRSRLIAVRFAASDADYAAWAANTITEAYLALARGEGLAAQGVTSSTLSQQVEDQRKRTVEAESAVEAKRVETRILTIRAMMADRIASSKPETVAATLEPAERARILREKLKSGVQPELADAEGDPALTRLVETRLRLEATLQQENKTLLDGHPRIKALKADLVMVRSRSAAAVQRYLAVLDAQVDTELDLTGSIPAVEASGEPLAALTTDLQTLETLAVAEREKLNALLADYRTTAAGSDDRPPSLDVRVLNWAQSPMQAENRQFGMAVMVLVAGVAVMIAILAWRFRRRNEEEDALFLRSSLNFDRDDVASEVHLDLNANAPLRAT